MNNCTFIGRMTANPSLKKVDVHDGKGQTTSVLNFYVAVDDGFRKDKDGNKIGTEFIHVTAWRGAAEAIAENMTKGREIALKGAIHLGSYTKDGKAYSCLDMPRPDGFEFLGKKINNEQKDNDEVDDDSTPFD